MKIWNKSFILLFITNLLMMAAFYASVPILPVYCQQLGITGSRVGVVLTAMSVTTVLFRPLAGYLLDNFNRYRVYLLFLALFCLPFPAFVLFPTFGALVAIRLYMGAVYSVCGSATTTLAGDVLPPQLVSRGVHRFALTISLGMAAGPFLGIQVQNHLSSEASFLALFALLLVALACVSQCRLTYPPVKRKPFRLADAFYRPALPFMVNMIFFMIPFGAVIAYTAILAQQKGLSQVTAYFYLCLVAGMLLSKFATQARIDRGGARGAGGGQPDHFICHHGQLLLAVHRRAPAAGGVPAGPGLRGAAAAVPVLRHRDDAGAQARRGQRHLSALLRHRHRHRLPADGGV